jgi:hypothetical protein
MKRDKKLEKMSYAQKYYFGNTNISEKWDYSGTY